MEITNVPIASLKIDEKNARKHSDCNIREVIRSLESFGQHAPIVVQRGTNKILIGNGRVEAMRRMDGRHALPFLLMMTILPLSDVRLQTIGRLNWDHGMKISWLS